MLAKLRILIVHGLLLAACCVSTFAANHTNVVLILADDLGWTDLACYGSKLYETPNIDRLARDGVKFTQHYSACTVCSPSRAALLTGKYPARLHITDWIPGMPPENPKLLVPDWTKYLPLEEFSLARAFKSAGYATASIGKWHLGGEPYYPDKHGFDLNLAGTDAPQTRSYFAPYNIATLPDGPDGEYLTDRLGSEAMKYLEQNQNKSFFLYLPHFAVHLPVQGKKDLVRKYQAKIQTLALAPDSSNRNARSSSGQSVSGSPSPRGEGRRERELGPLSLSQTNAGYAAMTESLDDAVGQVRRKLEELKLADHTIVIFASDNGGRVPTTSNLPLRVGKGSCYEGGTRVPLIIYWPGVTKPNTICETPVMGIDLYPTVLEMVGPQPNIKNMDGVSLVPLLRRTGELKRDELFWHYPHYQHYQLGGTTPYGAIRKGDFKLIEFFDDMRVELYNLKDDIGEQHNLAAQMPEKVEQLRQRLHAWRQEVGAQMPTRNPNYDPSMPEHNPSVNKKKKQEAGGA
jgi:arylsulfatase A